ncbi:MAG: type II toxin-antitoxin system YafQ family toxin [bacterium]|nr:type II toxin-antitoxin system YafQ family toxin [bacterium]
MHRVVRTRRFERSFRKLRKSGLLKDILRAEIDATIILLAEGKSLPASYSDHQLTGDLDRYRECHIRSDLLLVYERHDDKLVLVLIDIGSHSYLFE